MSSSILRRVISHQISRSCISHPCRKFGGGGHKELLRPSSSPWLMLPPCFKKRWLPACFGEGGQMTYKFYNPVKGKIVSLKNRGGKQDARALQEPFTRLVGSSHGWLAWSNFPNNYMFLSNPLSGRRIELPPVPVPSPPSKVILSCSPDNEEECSALMILGTRDRVAFCRPRHSTKWTVPHLHTNDYKNKVYRDFVYSPAQKSFVGFAEYYGWCGGNLEYWDIGDPSCPRMVRTSRFGRPTIHTIWNSNRCKETYLISSMDRLFLARRLLDSGAFYVYRVDDVGEREIGDYCLSLDDLSLFVGINHSLGVKASEIPKLKPNSIYYGGARYGYLKPFDIDTYDYPSRHLLNLWPLPWFTPSLL